MTLPNFMVIGLQIEKVQSRAESAPQAMPDCCLGLKITDRKSKMAALVVYGRQELRKVHNNLSNSTFGDAYVKTNSRPTNCCK